MSSVHTCMCVYAHVHRRPQFNLKNVKGSLYYRGRPYPFLKLHGWRLYVHVMKIKAILIHYFKFTEIMNHQLAIR